MYPPLRLYDFPAEHWLHLRTSSPIESVFAGGRLRTDVAKRARNRDNALFGVQGRAAAGQKLARSQRRAQPHAARPRRRRLQRTGAYSSGQVKPSRRR